MTRNKWLGMLLTLGLIASLIILGACSSDDDDDGADPTNTLVADVIDDDLDDDTTADGDNADDSDDADDSSTGNAAFADLAGEWVGVWNNDTFGSSAPITLSVSIGDDGSASMTLGLSSTADGAPFGIPNVMPTTLEGTITSDILTVTAEGHELFGDMTISILSDGTLEVAASMDGAPGIAGMTVSGTFDGNGMDATYTITFPDGSEATGTASLNPLYNV